MAEFAGEPSSSHRIFFTYGPVTAEPMEGQRVSAVKGAVCDIEMVTDCFLEKQVCELTLCFLFVCIHIMVLLFLSTVKKTLTTNSLCQRKPSLGIKKLLS